jgi:hypothetical protein
MSTMTPYPFLDASTSNEGLPLMLNLFGGPGIGKTTMAARLFVELKLRGLEAANPEEHAKLAIWKGRPDLLDQQLVILGRSWETLHALADKVDVVVMDSPLLLCSVYAGDKEKLHFHQTVADFHKRMPRLNIVLRRPQDLLYSQRGRRENVHSAKMIDEKVRNSLDAFGERFVEIDSSLDAAIAIADAALAWHKEHHPNLLD